MMNWSRAKVLLTKEEWIARYGGQALLDQEGFEVVPCEDCDDVVCNGWRVKKCQEKTC